MTDLMLTAHGSRRMQQRGVRPRAVEAVLDYGRVVYKTGAVVYVIGRREAEYWQRRGVNLWEYLNLHVLCTHDGEVITTYRNRSFRHLKCG